MPTQASPAGSAAIPSGAQMVQALHAAFGEHHVRAVHAKGVMATGTFEPSAEAAALSKASLFRAHDIPLLLRFSDFTGIPDIPDNIGDANPRGLALRFTLPDGSVTDIVSHSFNGFPTATAAEFRELLLAIAASGPSVAKPTPLDSFLAAHPIAKIFLTTQKPPPTSYVQLSYFGVNAFRFTDAAGQETHVRYRFVPVAGESFVPAEELAGKDPNYLVSELPGHLAKGPVVYKWLAQIAGPGDIIADPSVAWPDSRKLVELGTLRITAMAPDPVTTDRKTGFLPLNLPDGIAPADPMLTVRQESYPVSYEERQ